jgi:hypothetical protein
MVKEVEQYAIKSTSYNAIDGSNYFRRKWRYKYKGYRFTASYNSLVIENS